MHRQGFVALAATLWLATGWGVRAQAQQSMIVPGLMGPNALPAIPVEDAALAPTLTAEVGGALHLTGDDAADRTFAPRFRILVPFRQIAALEVEGTPFELWSVTPETRALRGGHATSGIAKGDLSFGARFVLLNERVRRPALALRLLTKSTSGKGLHDLRFTDAPGYAIEVLAARTVGAWPGAVRSLRVLTKLGLLSWSQGPGLQDDALDYGLAADLLSRAGTELRLELRGYQGYQSRDKPMLASVRVLQPVASAAALSFALNRGIRRDAPDWEVRAGVVLRLATPFGER